MLHVALESLKSFGTLHVVYKYKKKIALCALNTVHPIFWPETDLSPKFHNSHFWRPAVIPDIYL